MSIIYKTSQVGACFGVPDTVNTCIMIYCLQNSFMCLISFYTYITDEETEAESNLYSHLATPGRKYS